MRVELLNGANLAFIGDAYYELYIREHIINKGITNQKELHKECVKYVSAKGHSQIVQNIINFLTEEELSIYKRGRNYHYSVSRKNLSLEDYLRSSGLEALIGYLYLKKDIQRLEEIMGLAIKTIEEKNE